jgi:hypothetical protein
LFLFSTLKIYGWTKCQNTPSFYELEINPVYVNKSGDKDLEKDMAPSKT